MSEKIYAWLLRLFPPAFRGHYEEESLRLLRDRLRDEKGFFRRLRLGFDLIADIFGALPQAYRNSYPDVVPAGSPTPHSDGVPSFGVLQQEPMQRGTIIVAGVVSLTTALATFMYVIEPSTPDRSIVRNGRISPIEAVLERLNGPISPASAGSVHSEAPGASSAEIGRLKSQSIPTAKALLSARTNSTGALAEPSPQVSGDPLFVPSYPKAIRNVTRSKNLSGRWTASLPAVTGDADIPQEFIFRQESAKLTGTGRPDSTEQYSIIHGLVAGDSVSFELSDGRRRFLYDLKVEDKELRGTLSITSANENRTAEVWLERAN